MNCWILSTPRTGSTYLAELLNSTKLFVPEFQEYYCGGWEPFQKIIDQGPPPFAKIHYSQYRSNRPPLPEKRIRIRRKNFHETALSFCLINQYKVWNTTGDFPTNEINIPLDQIIFFYNRAKNDYDVWDNFGPFLEVNYEEICCNPEKTVGRCLSYMGLESEADMDYHNLSKKISYPNMSKHLRKMQAAYGV